MAYIDPLDVNDAGFPVKADHLLYDDKDYSIAISKFQTNNSHALGIRWNHSDHSQGFPYGYRGRPIWMIIPDNLAIPILETLLKLENQKHPVDRKKILDAIATIKSGK